MSGRILSIVGPFDVYTSVLQNILFLLLFFLLPYVNIAITSIIQSDFFFQKFDNYESIVSDSVSHMSIFTTSSKVPKFALSILRTSTQAACVSLRSVTK